MVCLSGGKDSLTLLHTLLQYQSHAQKEGVLFSIGAITVDPDSSGCDPCILIPHLKSLGVHYIIDDKKCDPGCATGQSKIYCKRTHLIIWFIFQKNAKKLKKTYSVSARPPLDIDYTLQLKVPITTY